MKILTVRNPWAWLIIAGPAPAGPKDIENRGWSTPYRGRLLIQAGAKTPSDYDWACAAAFARERGIELPRRHELDYGGIIGSVDMVDCVRSHPSKWVGGPVGWVLRDPRPLPFVPCIGKLYLFDAPADVMARIGTAA